MGWLDILIRVAAPLATVLSAGIAFSGYSVINLSCSYPGLDYQLA